MTKKASRASSTDKDAAVPGNQTPMKIIVLGLALSNSFSDKSWSSHHFNYRWQKKKSHCINTLLTISLQVYNKITTQGCSPHTQWDFLQPIRKKNQAYSCFQHTLSLQPIQRVGMNSNKPIFFCHVRREQSQGKMVVRSRLQLQQGQFM